MPFDCFEKGSKVGGNWCFRNDNGLSSAYDSLELNSSKTQTQYAAFPMPRDYPDYPGHRQVQAYFEAFVDHFGLDPHITFRTEVTRVGRADCGTGFDVTVGSGAVRATGGCSSPTATTGRRGGLTRPFPVTSTVGCCPATTTRRRSSWPVPGSSS
ncbi:MAG: hypothetical protein QOJ60_838 [Actinomycetota bacterium]|nr:hypothetical protein [Actinomycetota bacterium]